ncbi:rlmF [Symbiodinium necroappetens]|uniref:RlmF protein n=1 Tax=Symbiodinium necroappetens TaxID=1628268 RepID=A0A812ZGT3_9DINO|nr:rlmF [Symbiodinium necroappetens]
MGIDEFCEGIPELFGQATAFSMLKAKKKAEKAEKQLRRLKDKLGRVLRICSYPSLVPSRTLRQILVSLVAGVPFLRKNSEH